MSCNCPKCSYTPAELPRATMDELYCRLTWKMRDVAIPVEDKDTTAISNQAYISILAPGTVVKFDNRRYFYSCPPAMVSLEGSWINDECAPMSSCVRCLTMMALSK